MFRDTEMRGQSKRVGYGGVKFARITVAAVDELSRISRCGQVNGA